MNKNVSKPIQSLSAVDGLSISQMVQDMTARSHLINGYNFTTFPIQEGFTPHEWFQICKLFLVERGHIVVETNSYARKKHDPLTCSQYDLFNNPTEEWGVEVKWQSRW